MKSFDPNAKCPKCSCTIIRTRYVPDRQPKDIVSMDPDQERQEHINRTCKCCGYSWNEAPLDRGAK